MTSPDAGLSRNIGAPATGTLTAAEDTRPSHPADVPTAEPEELDEQWTIPSTSREDLKNRLNSGCVHIGVTGLPRTGKTDLMKAACKGELGSEPTPLLGFVVKVPAAADSNEIARRLVLELCGEILNRLGKNAGTRRRDISDNFAEKGSLIISAAVIAAGAVLLGLSAGGIHVNAQLDLGSFLILAGAVSLLARLGTRAGISRKSPALGREAKRSSELYRRAVALADSLEAEGRFETTFSSGWASGLTTGVQMGTSGTVSKKLLPMSITELAGHYEDLIVDYRRYNGPGSADTGKQYLLIGIDGLDKRGAGADIDSTLYELKGFFKIKGCRYLIALAEDSEPRVSFHPGLIDDIVRCELLILDDVKDFIKKQITRVKLPGRVAGLCFTASGALPGLTVSTTRLLRDFVEKQPEADLSLASICDVIVEKELHALSAQLRSAARALRNWAHQQQLFDWAEQLSGNRSADCIRGVAGNIRALAIGRLDMTSSGDAKLQLITHRAAALSYFCATLTDFFADDLNDEDWKRALEPKGDASLAQLARARQWIELATCGPAWTDISDFRVAWRKPVTRTASDSAVPNSHHKDHG